MKEKKITKTMLENLIRDKKLSRGKVAEKIGVTSPVLSRWVYTDIKIPLKYRQGIKQKLSIDLPDSHFTLPKSDLLPCFRNLLNEHGSKASLARHLKIKDSSLYALIYGKKKIPEHHVKGICEFFNGKVKPKDLKITYKSPLLPCFKSVLNEKNDKKDLAKHLKISISHLHSFVCGKKSIPKRHIEGICAYFKGQIKLSDLMNLTNNNQ